MAGKTLERLKVLLTADDSNLRSTFGNATKPISGFTSKLGELRAAALPVAGAVAAVGAAAIGAALKAGRFADKLLDLAQQTGLTTDQLQEFRRVETVAGVSQDTIAAAAQRLESQLQSGGAQAAQMQNALAKLGISANDAQGNIRPMSQLLPELITQLQGMENTTDRNVTAFDVFGRGASELLPVLGLGADKMAALRQEAHDLGLVIGEDQLEAANRFRSSWDGVKQSLNVATVQIGTELTPVFEKMADSIQTRWVPIIRGIAKAFRWVLDAMGGFTTNVQKIWIGLQGIVINAIQQMLAGLDRFAGRLPVLGQKISEARQAFDGWANNQMANLRQQMANLRTESDRVTESLDRQGLAAVQGAGKVQQAATSIKKSFADVKAAANDVAIANQQLSAGFAGLEEQAVGSSGRIDTTASAAFQGMAGRVAASAYKVLGAVQQVLAKLTGGGGIFGGILGGISGFFSGGPLGAALGFVGGFAEGGTIPAGGTALVGEAGPELVTAGVRTQVTPLGGGGGARGLRVDPSSIPPFPRLQTPNEAAIDTWWRQLFSEMVLDGKQRGAVGLK